MRLSGGVRINLECHPGPAEARWLGGLVPGQPLKVTNAIRFIRGVIGILDRAP